VLDGSHTGRPDFQPGAELLLVESVLLAAIQRDLFSEEAFMVFKQEVARLFAERQAREALKSLLGKTIVLHPCADGAGRYLTAEVTGDYEGFVRLAIGKNKAGGGQGS
jgi:hypothetical protein